jgi:hypothetical protein
MVVMAVALILFLSYHIYLTSLGMTTNESFKWGDVRRWHKSEMQRYNAAIKKGQSGVSLDTRKAQPIVGDGDVTCTPGASSGSVPDATEQTDTVQDPGPFPKNIYDHGFVENWKEVIFPRSLRKTVSTSNGRLKGERPAVDKPKAT